MPKKQPRSKRKKRKQPKVWTPPKDWTWHLWGLFGLNLVIGLVASPVTSATTIRIVGAPLIEQPRLERLAQLIDDRPYFLVDKDQVRSGAMENRAVQSAEYQANLFGRGVVTLRYRKAVATLGSGLYLSRDGSVFLWRDEVPVRILVEPPTSPDAKNLAVFGTWPTATVASMCENIAERLPDRDWRLVVAKTGFVSLVPAQGGTVEFGSFEEMDRKIETLTSILRDEPDLLVRVKELNLASRVPAIVP
jgi:hypothetical protein